MYLYTVEEAMFCVKLLFLFLSNLNLALAQAPHNKFFGDSQWQLLI